MLNRSCLSSTYRPTRAGPFIQNKSQYPFHGPRDLLDLSSLLPHWPCFYSGPFFAWHVSLLDTSFSRIYLWHFLFFCFKSAYLHLKWDLLNRLNAFVLLKSVHWNLISKVIALGGASFGRWLVMKSVPWWKRLREPLNFIPCEDTMGRRLSVKQEADLH